MPNLLPAIVLILACSARADFAEDFQAAKARLLAEDFTGAHLAFLSLAAEPPNEHGKTAALSWAAIALGRGGDAAAALDLANTIDDKPLAAYTRLKILSGQKRYEELVASSRNEAFAAWPDELNYQGFFLRGAACKATGRQEAALADFSHCLELVGSDIWIRLEALNNVAALQLALGMPEQAMATYQTIFQLYDDVPSRKGRWLYPQALLDAAHFLMSQEKFTEATAILDKYAERPGTNYRNIWTFLVLEAYGDIAVAQGRTGDALARYRDAITIDTHEACIDRANAKIETLTKAAKTP